MICREWLTWWYQFSYGFKDEHWIQLLLAAKWIRNHSECSECTKVFVMLMYVSTNLSNFLIGRMHQWLSAVSSQQSSNLFSTHWIWINCYYEYYIAKSFFPIVGKSGNKNTEWQTKHAWFLECFILSLKEEEEEKEKVQFGPNHLNGKSFTNWNYFSSNEFQIILFSGMLIVEILLFSVGIRSTDEFSLKFSIANEEIIFWNKMRKTVYYS